MSNTDTEEDPMRAFARALFGADETTDETEEAGETTDDTGKPQGNFVPNEGNIPKSRDTSDEQFVRILFDNN